MTRFCKFGPREKEEEARKLKLLQSGYRYSDSAVTLEC